MHMRPWEGGAWGVVGGTLARWGTPKDARAAVRLLERADAMGGGEEVQNLLSEAWLLAGDAEAGLRTAACHGQRGRCMYALGRHREAIAEFKQALLGGTPCMEWLGCAYEAAGDAAAALACAERACEEAEAVGDAARLSACLLRSGLLHGARGDLDEQVSRLRRAQIVEREWKSAESDVVKGALADVRAAQKAARKG